MSKGFKRSRGAIKEVGLLRVLTLQNHELLNWVKPQIFPRFLHRSATFYSNRLLLLGTALATSYVQPRLVFCHQSECFVNNTEALFVF